MAIQMISFHGTNDDIDQASAEAIVQANLFLREEDIPPMDTEAMRLQVTNSMVDGVTWHYATVTLLLDCSEQLAEVISQRLEKALKPRSIP